MDCADSMRHLFTGIHRVLILSKDNVGILQSFMSILSCPKDACIQTFSHCNSTMCKASPRFQQRERAVLHQKVLAVSRQASSAALCSALCLKELPHS